MRECQMFLVYVLVFHFGFITMGSAFQLEQTITCAKQNANWRFLHFPSAGRREVTWRRQRQKRCCLVHTAVVLQDSLCILQDTRRVFECELLDQPDELHYEDGERGIIVQHQDSPVLLPRWIELLKTTVVFGGANLSGFIGTDNFLKCFLSRGYLHLQMIYWNPASLRLQVTTFRICMWKSRFTVEPAKAAVFAVLLWRWR